MKPSNKRNATRRTAHRWRTAPRRRRIRRVLTLAAVLLAGLLWLIADGGREDDVACVHGHGVVVDGDTLDVDGTRIRVWGINAPEARTSAGDDATAAFAALLAQGPVTCCPPPSGQEHDWYGRTVALCRLPDGRDVAMVLVRAGHAEDWPEYSGGYYAQ